LTGQRFTAFRRAIQIVRSIITAGDLDLPAAELPVAQDAAASIIQRIPTAILVRGP
jgi:hypothetical protein